MQPIRIAESVYQLLGPGYVYPFDSTVFLVKNGDRYFIVDAGSGLPGSPEAIVSSIIQLGMEPFNMRLHRIVSTHPHIYNAGGLYFFHRHYSTIVVAHQFDARALETGDPEKTASRELGVDFRPVPVGHVIREDKASLDGIVIYHTPGHTPGSISILVPGEEIVLIVGDALGRLKREWGSDEESWWKSFDLIANKLKYDIICTSIRCYRGVEKERFLRTIEEDGPIWLDRE